MTRGYQYHFSENMQSMYDVEGRRKKAATIYAVIMDYLQRSPDTIDCLNVGGSAGIIDEYLSRYFHRVIGLDIDEKAIRFAKQNFSAENLFFQVGDAMNLGFTENSFDVVVLSQVYEHVPDAERLMDEIFRVLKPGGVCFFAAGNRLMWNEPHYNLPLLSVMPVGLSHYYLKLSGKGNYYYERHLTFWGLKKLVRQFHRQDYTLKAINEPVKYKTDYMLRPGSKKQFIANLVARYFIWMVPGYLWILEKKTS